MTAIFKGFDTKIYRSLTYVRGRGVEKPVSLDAKQTNTPLNYDHNLAAKAWFPHGRECVVNVVEIKKESISTTVTTLLRHVYDHMETRLKLAKFISDKIDVSLFTFTG